MLKYIKVFNLQIKRNMMYKFQTWSRVLGDIMFIFMWYFVWKGLYNGQESVNGVSFDKMVIYALAAQFLITLNNAASPIWRTDGLFRKGDIVNELVKPYNFTLRILFECMANSVSYLLLSTIWVFSAAIVLLKVKIQVAPEYFVLFFVSGFLGYLIRYFIELCFSYLSFWITNIGGIRILFLFSISLFSGSVVPLWYFPKAIRMVADFLPLKYIYYVPNLMLTGIQTIHEGLCYIGLQFLWLTILIALSEVIWKMGNQKVVINGG